MTPKIKLVISIVIIILLAGFVYFLIKKPQIIKKPAPFSGEKNFEDVLKSLTAPAGNALDVPADVLKSLTAPGGKPKTVPKDVLESLTAPAK